MIVTIDGPAGSGKSTIARRVAQRSNLYFLSSGSLYRGLTWSLSARFGDELEGLLESPGNRLLIEYARERDLHIDGDAIVLDSRILGENELRNDLTEAFVAQISAIPEIREIVKRILLDVSRTRDLVVEGRDMSTVVFPHADLKFYLDASVESRARRRYEQGTSDLRYDQILKSIADRDHIDRTKEVGALKLSDEAMYLDTSDLTIEQVCEIVLKSIQEHK